MLLIELAQLIDEMARPAKICPDCGKSMAGNHFWYKGGWKCKKSNRPDNKPTEKEDGKSAKKAEDNRARNYEKDPGDEDDDVKSADRVKAPAKKVGTEISAAEMRDVKGDTEAEARAYVNDVFPKASPEAKARAVNVWKAKHKDKAE